MKPLRLFGVVCGLCLCAIFRLDARRPLALAFVIEMHCDTNSVAQVFYDVGRNFNQEDSSTLGVVASARYATLRFPLPDAPIQALRFDPLNGPGGCAVRRAAIEDPGGRLVLSIGLGDLRPTNQIASSVNSGSAVTFETLPGANDPTFSVALHGPVDPLFSVWNRITLASGRLVVSLLVAGLVTFLYVRVWPRAAVDRALDGLARSMSDPEYLVFDRFAAGCYVAAVVLFITLVAGAFHGSSISLLSTRGLPPPEWARPVLGAGKAVRVDEWGFHTPAILNQIYRARPFDAANSEPGPDYASLVANIPVRHVTTLFRPQFWGFFVLPPAYAFSFYWQFKGLLLFTGVFSLLLLLTHSSRIAAFGALWYLFSPFTQWTYSWASLLPEMVGLFCLVLCATFYLSVGRRPVLRLAAAAVCVACAVNFAMCAYVPHQIPLVWLGVFLTFWWIVARASSIFTRDAGLARAGSLAAVWLAVGAALLLVYLDAQEGLRLLANTNYPGRRSLAGGGYPLQILFSHFFQYWQDETHIPIGFGNISECSGFLWLAPATLFGWRTIDGGQRAKKLAYLCLFLFGVFIFTWMTVPLPGTIGRLLLLDKSGIQRSLHALGLVNVAAVTLFLSLQRARPNGSRRAGTVMLGLAILMSVWPVLLLTNNVDAGFLTVRQLLVAAAYATVLFVAVVEYRFGLLAALIVFPQIASFALVNPVDRGLHAVQSTRLFQFVRARPELLEHKWIVYSVAFTDPGLFSAAGCDVVTGLKFVPDFKTLGLFDPNGVYRPTYNQSGYLLATPAYGEPQARFEGVQLGVVNWHVNPLDPAFRRLDIRYAAFADRPPPDIAAKLTPVADGRIDNYFLYELPGAPDQR